MNQTFSLILLEDLSETLLMTFMLSIYQNDSLILCTVSYLIDSTLPLIPVVLGVSVVYTYAVIPTANICSLSTLNESTWMIIQEMV